MLNQPGFLKGKKSQEDSLKKSSRDIDSKEKEDAETIELIAKKSFAMADYDEDGFISPVDFKNLLVDLANSNDFDCPSEKECGLAFFAVDEKNNSRVSYEEWREFISKYFKEIKDKPKQEENSE